MTYIDKLFTEADKIWPRKQAFQKLSLTFISLLILGMTSYLISGHIKDKKMRAFELNGKVERLIKSEKIYFYRINGNWYGIQSEMNNVIEENDSVLKERNSNKIIVFRQTVKINDYKASEMTLKNVSENKQLMRQLEKDLSK